MSNHLRTSVAPEELESLIEYVQNQQESTDRTELIESLSEELKKVLRHPLLPQALRARYESYLINFSHF